MVFDGTISLGAIMTAVVVLVGFVSTGTINAISFGRYLGAVDNRLNILDKRMETMEQAEREMTQIMVSIGQQKTEIHLLAKRVDDVQQYGSHRLAEVLAAIRVQIMAEFKDRFDLLHNELSALKQK